MSVLEPLSLASDRARGRPGTGDHVAPRTNRIPSASSVYVCNRFERESPAEEISAPQAKNLCQVSGCEDRRRPPPPTSLSPELDDRKPRSGSGGHERCPCRLCDISHSRRHRQCVRRWVAGTWIYERMLGSWSYSTVLARLPEKNCKRLKVSILLVSSTVKGRGARSCGCGRGKRCI